MGFKPGRTKFWYWSDLPDFGHQGRDRTDPRANKPNRSETTVGQNEQTKAQSWARSQRTKIWTRRRRPKTIPGPDRTDPRPRSDRTDPRPKWGQTEQTQFNSWLDWTIYPGPDRLNCADLKWDNYNLCVSNYRPKNLLTFFCLPL